MSDSEYSFCDDSFGGTTKLFPLPGLVLFPHVIQALHIFEPRYRQMLEDAMVADKLVSMALLGNGWQGDYEGAPPVESVVCLGKIVSRTVLDDGCSNILLMGLRRARILQELVSDESVLYRTAKIEIIHDVLPCTEESANGDLRKELMESFQRCLPKSAFAARQLTQNLGNQISLSILTDLISYSVDLTPLDKQRLLAEVNVELRAKSLLEYFDRFEQAKRSRDRGCFPPSFSDN